MLLKPEVLNRDRWIPSRPVPSLQGVQVVSVQWIHSNKNNNNNSNNSDSNNVHYTNRAPCNWRKSRRTAKIIYCEHHIHATQLYLIVLTSLLELLYNRNCCSCIVVGTKPTKLKQTDWWVWSSRTNRVTAQSMECCRYSCKGEFVLMKIKEPFL